MQVKDIVGVLEAFAPPVYQEGYDNCGLQVGNPADAVTGVLLTLDITEAVLDEAIARNCNLVVAHHPVIFSGLKSLTGRNYVERTVLKAIKAGINIYAAHTNADNVAHGVNAKIAEKLGLTQVRVLQPKAGLLMKLQTYAPVAAADSVRDALFAAGAGHIGNYAECSFTTDGVGTFRASAHASPTIGTAGGPRTAVPETKIEVLVAQHAEHAVLHALMAAHPYEEVAYELIPLKNLHQQIGAGLVGNLPVPVSGQEFLAATKAAMHTGCIRHTPLLGRPIQRVAVCGGSGSFLIKDALRAGADVLVTADFKYHQFFDAEGRILIADIGHYESEQFTPELFHDILNEKFPNFAVLLSNINTNPVQYFC